MNFFNDVLQYELLHLGEYIFKVSTLVNISIILIATKLFLWLFKKAVFSKNRLKGIEAGNAYSLYQIVRYLIWVGVVTLVLHVSGINVTALLLGSAALFIGIGLGLQSLFNDFISGIVLLTEGTIKVGDVLEIDGDVILVKMIGLRTTKGLNRDEIMVILPNSVITSGKVINWSHRKITTRFKIDVGVAYGSNVELVIKALEESANEHPEVFNHQDTEVRFTNFGNSSLDFQLLFYSNNIFKIEKVKSDIRKVINKKFIENGITIPFPQMDLHLRSNDTQQSIK